MRKMLWFVLVFLFSTTLASAQSKVLYGFLRDSITHLPIAGGTLSNNTAKKKTVTDSRGFFQLPVAPDDLIYALSPQYRYDTLRYSMLFQDTVIIYLPPVNVLENVTIETGYLKYQRDSAQRRADFEETKGHTMKTFDQGKRKETFGLTLNLDRLFKSKYKNQNNAEKSFSGLEKEEYVRFRFSPQTVTYYTGLKGDALISFMSQYTPSYEWLRQHVEREQLIDYLSGCLKAFRNKSH